MTAQTLSLFDLPPSSPALFAVVPVKAHQRRVRAAEKPAGASESLPYAKGSATSQEAAQKAQGTADTDRKRIYSLLLARGPMTLEQIETALCMSGNSVRPRRKELEAAGLVRDSGRTAKTKSGRNAVLWEVAE